MTTLKLLSLKVCAFQGTTAFTAVLLIPSSPDQVNAGRSRQPYQGVYRGILNLRRLVEPVACIPRKTVQEPRQILETAGSCVACGMCTTRDGAKTLCPKETLASSTVTRTRNRRVGRKGGEREAKKSFRQLSGQQHPMLTLSCFK